MEEIHIAESQSVTQQGLQNIGAREAVLGAGYYVERKHTSVLVTWSFADSAGGTTSTSSSQSTVPGPFTPLPWPQIESEDALLSLLPQRLGLPH